jgi:hypothetical protein
LLARAGIDRSGVLGGKYQGDLQSPKNAMTKGVEAVLNRIVEVPEMASSQAA